MPAYNDLRPDADFDEMDFELAFPGGLSQAVKKRTIEYLLALRKGLDQQVSVKKSDYNLLIASWNIKEFGHTKQRLPEAYYYTAEIMSRFDRGPGSQVYAEGPAHRDENSRRRLVLYCQRHH